MQTYAEDLTDLERHIDRFEAALDRVEQKICCSIEELLQKLQSASPLQLRLLQRRVARNHAKSLGNSMQDDPLDEQDESTRPNCPLPITAQEAHALLPLSLCRQMKPHQIEGFLFLWNRICEHHRTGCILADEFGLGKTLQGIALISAFASHIPRAKILLLATFSATVTWGAEWLKWKPFMRNTVQVYTPEDWSSANERTSCINTWKRKGGLMVMSYDTFRSCAMTYQSSMLDPGPDLIILDEGHRLRSRKSTLYRLIQKVRTPRRLAITGFPIQNTLLEYYNLVNFVLPDYLGTYSDFKTLFDNPIQKGYHLDSTESQKWAAKRRVVALTEEMRPYILRRPLSIMSHTLPKLREFVIRFPLSAYQIEVYRKLVELEIWTLHILFVFYYLSFLLCNHPSILRKVLIENLSTPQSDRGQETEHDIDTSDVEGEQINNLLPPEISDSLNIDELMPHTDQSSSLFESSPKMGIAFALIKQFLQTGEKVLVFSQSIATIDFIENHLRQTYPADGPMQGRFLRMDGSTPFIERRSMIHTFSSSRSAQIFLISTKAGGESINLTAATRVIILDCNWNPNYDIQAIFRAYRIGQTKPVYVYRLVTMQTAEETVYMKQLNKLALSMQILDEVMIPSMFTRRELRNYFQIPVPARADTPYPNGHHECLEADSCLRAVVEEYTNTIPIRVHEQSTIFTADREDDLSPEDVLDARRELAEHRRLLRTGYKEANKRLDSSQLPPDADFHTHEAPSDRRVYVPNLSQQIISDWHFRTDDIADMSPCRSTPKTLTLGLPPVEVNKDHDVPSNGIEADICQLSDPFAFDNPQLNEPAAPPPLIPVSATVPSFLSHTMRPTEDPKPTRVIQRTMVSQIPQLEPLESPVVEPTCLPISKPTRFLPSIQVQRTVGSKPFTEFDGDEFFIEDSRTRENGLFQPKQRDKLGSIKRVTREDEFYPDPPRNRPRFDSAPPDQLLLSRMHKDYKRISRMGQLSTKLRSLHPPTD